MDAWLDGLPVGGFSAGAILGIVILMILRGQLVTKREHEETRVDRDTFRAAWEAEVERGRVKDAQLSEFLEYAKTADRVIRALPVEGMKPDVPS